MLGHSTPQAVFDLKDINFKGASPISPIYTQLKVQFFICDKDNKIIFKDVECAPKDDIDRFFEENKMQVFFFYGANYIDFDEIENPLKRNFVLLGDPMYLNPNLVNTVAAKLSIN